MTSNTLSIYFAKQLLNSDQEDERSKFLKDLFDASYDGHICLFSDDPPSLPEEIVSSGDAFFCESPVVRDQNRFYLQKNWVIESVVLEEVQRLRKRRFEISGEFEEKLENTSLLPLQKKALKKAFLNSFTIISGGPGTGKTHTAACFVEILKQLAHEKDFKVILAAPTARAASHLQSVLKVKAQATTLHKLLKIIPRKNTLFDPLSIDADLVIVDEASMLDVHLLAKLLKSIQGNTRLLLMGDADQLPPVEAGSIFQDLAELLGEKLIGSMRTSNQDLKTLAENVNEGKLPATLGLLNESFDENFIERLYQRLDPFLSNIEPDPLKLYQAMNHFRVLSALRQGPFGIDVLNEEIFKKINGKIRVGNWWALPIMIRNNAPDLDLYNGTCGVLVGRARARRIDFYDSYAYFPQKVAFRALPRFELAFCLSIHKAQGSEFEKVLALFPQGSENFGKEALYTAITRAKKNLEIIAEKKTLEQMVKKTSQKKSGFKERFSL